MQIREFCYGTFRFCIESVWVMFQNLVETAYRALRIFSSFIPCSVIQEKITIHEFYYILYNKI